MLYLKKFNESFDPQDYMDYLLSEVEESNILENYTNDNFVFVEYGITLDQMSILNSYLDNNKRFKDVKDTVKFSCSSTYESQKTNGYWKHVSTYFMVVYTTDPIIYEFILKKFST